MHLTDSSPSIVVSGMRTTGPLHLGHYHGVLKNWLQLQSSYQCFFFAANWHALTTHYENPKALLAYTRRMIIEWLAVGLDPNNCTLFVQSDVPMHAELQLLLSMITPVSWLERVPTYKEQQQQLAEYHLNTYGFLGYPVLQSADVLLYKGQYVPVGEDQVAHLELTREITRRFNHLYCQETPLFSEPTVLLTASPKVPGTDGRKMSKSYQNTIELCDSPKVVTDKIRTMKTDPARQRRRDPGTPEKCPVWDFHQLYSSSEQKAWVHAGCTSASIGCLECKAPIIDSVLEELNPIRARVELLEQDTVTVNKIISAGCEKATEKATHTLNEVRKIMGISRIW